MSDSATPALSAGLEDVTVRLHHGLPSVPEYAVIALDGEPAVTLDGYQLTPPYGGHGWVETPGTVTATLRGSVRRPEPGDVRVTAAFRATGTDAPTVLETTAHVTGTPTPFALPTVPSGQAVEPGRTSVFYTEPDIVEADGIALSLHAAAVSHLELQCFRSPAHAPGLTSFRLWRAEFERVVVARVALARQLGFRVVALGDEFVRYAEGRDWLTNSPWAPHAVRHVAAFLRYSGIVDAVEMNDETNGNVSLYGPAVGVFVENWRDAGGPPIAWPTGDSVNQWEVPERSDYSSRQGDPAGLGGPGGVRMPFMPDGTLSAHQYARFVAGGMARLVPADRPWGALVGVCGRHYYDRDGTPGYQPGDQLIRGEVPPHHVAAQVWLALAHGASHVRAYSYDWPGWREQRAAALQLPAADIQHGTAPGDARWVAMSATMNAMKLRVGRLAGTPYTPVAAGPWVVGRRGDLAWAVNCAERALPAPNGPTTVLSASGEAAGATTVPAGGVAFYDV